MPVKDLAFERLRVTVDDQVLTVTLREPAGRVTIVRSG